MPTCAVPSCRSGHNSYNKTVRRQAERGLRHIISFFSFPKDDNLRKKWVESLSNLRTTRAKNGPVICEKHFKKSDIIKYDVIKLSDGNICLFERTKRKLRPQAIPLPLSHTKNTESKKKKKTVMESIKIEKDIDEENKETTPKKKTNPLEKNNIFLMKVPLKKYDVDPVTVPHTNDSSWLEVSDVKPFLFPTMEDTVYNVSECNTFMVPEHIKTLNEEGVDDNVLNNLKTKSLKLPDNWLSTNQPDGSVKIFYVHPIREIVYVTCLINTDMSVQAITLNKNVKIDCDIKLSSTQNLIDLLLRLEISKCCEGTGLDTNRFAEECEGFVTCMEEETITPELSISEDRCKSCSRQRQSILMKRYNTSRSIKELKNKNRKLKSLNCRIKVLEETLGYINHSS